jgi:hypothetical protein
VARSENRDIFLGFCLHIPEGGDTFRHFIVTKEDRIESIEAIGLTQVGLE